MMCHKIGLVPIDTIGFGINSVCSLSLVPNPPAKMMTGIFFIFIPLIFMLNL